ncbi:hypothetical protein D3C72_986120 [compost metagenome]
MLLGARDADAAQQHGADAGGHRRVGIHQRPVAPVVQHRGLRLQRGQAFAHRSQLRTAHERAHAHALVARVAHADASQFGANGLGCSVVHLGRHQDAADRRALLARLHRHLAHDFAHQQVEGLAARGLARQQHGAVEAVGLDVHAHRTLGHGRVRADHARCLGRAGERHHVEGPQLVHQPRRAAGDDRQCARRKHPCIHHILDHALGEPGRGRGGLDDDRNAREQGRRGLFPQPPGREVEGVDEQRHALCGHRQVLRLEGRVLAQPGRIAVAQGAGIAQGVAPFGVLAQGEDGAVDVHARIVLHRAGIGGSDLVVGVAVGEQHLDDGGQQRGALTVGQCAQGRSALLAGKGKGLGQVEPGGVYADQFVAQHGVEQRGAVAGACLPTASGEIGKKFGHVDKQRSKEVGYQLSSALRATRNL